VASPVHFPSRPVTGLPADARADIPERPAFRHQDHSFCVIPQTCVWGLVHSRTLHLVPHRRFEGQSQSEHRAHLCYGNRQRGATRISRLRSREAAKAGLPTGPAARSPGLCPRRAFLLQPSNSRLQTHLHQVSLALRIRLDHLGPLTSPSLNSYGLLLSMQVAPAQKKLPG